MLSFRTHQWILWIFHCLLAVRATSSTNFSSSLFERDNDASLKNVHWCGAKRSKHILREIVFLPKSSAFFRLQFSTPFAALPRAENPPNTNQSCSEWRLRRVEKFITSKQIAINSLDCFSTMRSSLVSARVVALVTWYIKQESRRKFILDFVAFCLQAAATRKNTHTTALLDRW